MDTDLIRRIIREHPQYKMLSRVDRIFLEDWTLGQNKKSAVRRIYQLCRKLYSDSFCLQDYIDKNMTPENLRASASIPEPRNHIDLCRQLAFICMPGETYIRCIQDTNYARKVWRDYYWSSSEF